MKMNTTFLFCILLGLLVLSLNKVQTQPQPVMQIIEEDSFIQLKRPAGDPIKLTEFQNGTMEYQEGSQVFVHIELNKVMPSQNIPDNYYLQLRTNLLVEDKPDAYWRYEGYETQTIETHEAIVWNNRNEHWCQRSIVIELLAYVPESRIKSTEPGYGESIGFGKNYVYIDLIIKDKDAGVIQWIHLRDDPNETLNFWTTNTQIEEDKETVSENTIVNSELESNLREAFEENGIGEVIADFSSMGNEISNLYVEGHPGWARELSEDYKRINSGIASLTPKECEPCPTVGGFLLMGLILGVAGGLLTGFIFSRAKYVRMIPPDGIKTQLQKVKDRVNESTDLVKDVYDKEPRDELFKAKEELQKISRDLGSIIGRLRL